MANAATPPRVFEKRTFSRPFGVEVEASAYHPQTRRDVIGGLDTSAAGNVVFRCGTMGENYGWEQRLYVVLTPEETQDLVDQLFEMVPSLTAPRK